MSQITQVDPFILKLNTSLTLVELKRVCLKGRECVSLFDYILVFFVQSTKEGLDRQLTLSDVVVSLSGYWKPDSRIA